MVNPALTETQRMRLEKVFREAFGRELTADERKFLGLSVVVSPPEDEDVVSLRPRPIEEDEDLGPIAKKASA